MSVSKIRLPRNARDLLKPERRADMQKAVDILNAYRGGNLSITSNGELTSTRLQLGGNGSLFGISASTLDLDPETVAWMNAARTSGGTFTTEAVVIANNLILALKSASFGAKILYLLPMLGGNLATALVPLRNKLGVGPATNTGFTNASFNQSAGLQGNGVNQILDSLVQPDSLGVSTAGGVGWFENNIGSADRGPTGYAHNPGGGSRAYGVFIAAASYGFDWGKGAEVLVSGRPGNGHYYGQSPASDLRQMFFNGSLVGTDTTPAIVDDAAFSGIRLMGTDTSNVVPGPYFWGGRCACTYFTNGTMTVSEVATFNTILLSNLLRPSRKPTF